MQQSEIQLKESLSSLTDCIKFTTREDLTPELRCKIGRIALWGANWGRISRLSKRFGISRTTVYALRDRLSMQVSAAFTPPVFSSDAKVLAREQSIRQMLLLRFVGGCCLSATSALMASNGYALCSPGSISGVLSTIGSLLSNTVHYAGSVYWVCDEIFHLGSVPILVTVEPRSGAVLRIEIVKGSLKDGWKAHWQVLRQSGLLPLGMACDDGWMLRAARLEEEGLAFQPDTYHAIAHRLGVFDLRLQKAAYKAIEAEYERQTLCANTQKPKQLPKFKEQLAKLQGESRQAIEQSEQFRFLYRHLLAQLQTFDRHGLPRKAQKARQEAECALDLLETLNITGLKKELDAIRKNLPELFGFLDKAAKTCQLMLENQLFDDRTRPFWCAAWQCLKNANKIKNNPKLQKHYQEQCKQWLQLLEQDARLIPVEFEENRAGIFAMLDGIVQSSSAVEMFNSVLRPFLNTSRDQISQQTLNLIMHYYNHRKFARGKRKGNSPMEILTGTKQDDDWLDKLMCLVRLHNI